MVDKKVSELPTAFDLLEDDTFYIIQGGLDKQGTYGFIKENLERTTLEFTERAEDAAIAAEADADQTALDRIQTGSDVITTNNNVVSSTNAKNLAQEWASKAEDDIVSGGLYSSLHYAAKADDSAISALGSASTATTKAGEADSSATLALGYKEDAELAATNAAASYDAFDDRYLGAKASDPTLDNDGTALLDGALYWNSTASELRVYSLSMSTWKPIPTNVLTPEQFGGGVGGDDVAAFTALVDELKLGIVKSVRIAGSYNLPKGLVTVNDFGISEYGDPAFDILNLFAVMIDGLENVEFDATGAVFTTDSGTPFVFYRSIGCRWVGGSFTRTGSDVDVGADQATAVLITRSLDCCGKYVSVDGYYRNLFAYRAPKCGFTNCYSINARYYNYYTASELDIALTDSPDQTWHYQKDNYAKGGRYGNYFADNTVVAESQSEDCAPSGNSAAHIKTERGNYIVLNNRVYESSVQNSGADRIDGISAAKPISVLTDIGGIQIVGNEVDGCYFAYGVKGVDGFALRGNKAKNYYQTGYALLTEILGGTTFNLKNGVFSDNTIGNMNDASTRVNTGNDKNAGLQLEQNNAISMENIVLSGNLVDALGANVTKTPSFGVYIEATAGSITAGNNLFKENVSNTIPSWIYETRVSKQVLVLSSSGTTSAPTAIDSKYTYDGIVRLFNSNISLPAAAVGMCIKFTATSSTVRIYVNGASDSATGANTIYTSGSTSTQRNIQFSGPGTVVLTCESAGQWIAARDGGTTLTVTP